MAKLSYNGNIDADIQAATNFIDAVDSAIKNIDSQLAILNNTEVWNDQNSSKLLSDASNITSDVKEANTKSKTAASEYLTEVSNIISETYTFGE